MPPKEKELREVFKMGIKTLIFQEVRLLRLERTFTPDIIIDEMSRSIRGTKKEIVKLTRTMGHKERAVLLKRMVRQSIDEEIDQGIQIRKNKCFRCIHVRYFDDEGSSHVNLPIRTGRVQLIGCDEIKLASKDRCRRFVGRVRATSLEDYVSEMALLYELREMFERFKEIWEDYLLP